MAPRRSGSAEAPPRALRVRLAAPVDPVPAGAEARLLGADPDPVVLSGAWAGGGVLLAARPVRIAPAGTDPFTVLGDPGPAPADAPDGFVGGGWFGYLGYGLVTGAAVRPRRLPVFHLGFYDHVLRRDRAGDWWFEALWTAERAAALEARRAQLAARLTRGVSPGAAVASEPWTATPGPAGHARAVAAARRRIAAGDLFQANVALRLHSRLHGAPVDLFCAAAAALAPDRAAFLAGDWGAVVSLSPELFLARHGRQVVTRPIKGTRPRTPGGRAELAASAKDRAENVMIVDLMRNDLGRVAQTGTVLVTELAEVRPGPGVWHLVSEVRARLRPDVDDGELLRATFPPGSVTGAPKRAATQVIDELESSGREVFTGAIGFASPVAGLELSVVIRTIEVAGRELWLDVGGGIVADSDPEEEAREALAKARPLLEAIDGRLAPAPASTPAPAPLRHGPVAPVRPDARGGVFETLAVHGARPVALTAHLQRLAASAQGLYGTRLPSGLAARCEVACRGIAAGRLRIEVDGTGTVVSVAAGAEPAVGSLPETLVPVTLPGGLGAHKWRDRRWLTALGAQLAPAVPLLVDLDGRVLEAAYAAVLVLDDAGILCAPPLDGRILPSVTRALALGAARAHGVPVRVRPIMVDELPGAREVLLASAVRGVRAVAGPGTLASRLAGAGTHPVMETPS